MNFTSGYIIILLIIMAIAPAYFIDKTRIEKGNRVCTKRGLVYSHKINLCVSKKSIVGV